MSNPAEDLILKGPVSSEEASAAANAVKDTAEVLSNDDTKSGDIFKVFEAVKEGRNVADVLKKEEEDADLEEKEEGDKSKVDKADNKSDEKVVQKDEPKVEDKKSLPPTARPTKKTEVPEDLTGIIPESAAPFFKAMSNQAREWVVAELKRNAKQVEELKALKAPPERKEGELPSGWYEHQHAYILTPQFQQLNAQAEQVKNIENHYRQQLINIKEGEDWADLVMNGDKIAQVMRKADATSEVSVMRRIQECAMMSQNYETQRGALVQQWNSNVFNHRGKVQELEKEWFPQYADEKENESNEYLKTIRQIQKANGIDGDRTAGFLAKLYAFSMEILKENEELSSRLSAGDTGKKLAEKLAAKNGPTGDEINKGEQSKNRVVDPDEIPFMADEFAKRTGN